jgi:ABC-type Mn2+/Zn2+ transport system permease subunit
MVIGLAVSYAPRLPAGATIIQIAALGYAAALIAAGFSRRKAGRT